MEAVKPLAVVPSPIDLSQPDSTLLVRGRSRAVEALWLLIAAPILASKVIPFSGLRARLLRLFGAKVGRGVYFKPGLRVKFPWYLSIGDHCWVGEDVWIDNLAQVTIASHVCISQGVYLCTGNHDWSSRNMRLFLKPIRIDEGAWIGARSVVCPGVRVSPGAILTVGSVAVRNLPAFEIHGGNPARFLRRRVMTDPQDQMESL